MATAFASGIEWATLTSSTWKGPRVKRSPGATTVIGIVSAPGSEASLARKRPAVKAVAKTGTRSRGQSSTSAP